VTTLTDPNPTGAVPTEVASGPTRPRRHRRHLALGVSALAVLAPLAACGSGTSSQTGSVKATLTDHTIDLSSTRAKAGPVTFEIANDADTTTHELVVVKTDLPPDELPTDADGAMDEKGEGLTFVDEKEDIEPGARTSLTVDLQPGRYVVLCNLEDHYAMGMYRSFDVT
jgi:uncharacterized cupredoxin-like copper-binding protein